MKKKQLSYQYIQTSTLKDVCNFSIKTQRWKYAISTGYLNLIRICLNFLQISQKRRYSKAKRLVFFNVKENVCENTQNLIRPTLFFIHPVYTFVILNLGFRVYFYILHEFVNFVN